MKVESVTIFADERLDFKVGEGEDLHLSDELVVYMDESAPRVGSLKNGIWTFFVGMPFVFRSFKQRYEKR